MKVIRVIFEVRQDDEGDVTYRVEARHGKSGECPPFHVLHDSHFSQSALAELRRAANAAIYGRLDSLTAVHDRIDGPVPL